MAMLKLTSAKNGDPILVNPHHLASVYEGKTVLYDDKGMFSGEAPCTVVSLANGHSFEVKEKLKQFEWTLDIKHLHGA